MRPSRETLNYSLAGSSGFVSFDAEQDTVHVTQIEGCTDAEERLLEEPCRFARNEEMVVEMLVVGEDRDLRAIAEDAGFEDRGTGPVFEGTPTVRYRLETNREPGSAT